MGSGAATLQQAPKKEENYGTYVQNTIGFAKKLDSCKTDGQKADAVREFMEGGGLRTGLKPVSTRKYSSVLYFESGLNFQVGTTALKFDGSQSTEPNVFAIPPGSLVEFEYNTEKGAALILLNNRDEVVRISIDGRFGAPMTVNPTEPEAVNVFFEAIKSTVKLYASDKMSATFMEQAMDALYGVGHKFSKHKGPYMSTMPSPVGLEAMISALRGAPPVYGPLGQAKDQTIGDWADKIDEMVNPKNTTIGISGSASQRQEVIRELKLTDEETSNRYAGFLVKDGRIALNFYNYMNLKGEKTEFKPVLMYQIQGGGQGLNVDFKNHSFVKVPCNTFPSPKYRKDYDNTQVQDEQDMEDRLTAIYNQRMRNQEDKPICIFAANIVMPDSMFAKFAQSFAQEFKSLCTLP